jgi:hypothetical protein
MYPTVTFDDPSGTYTFRLWRNDKEVIHKLRGLAVYLEVIADDDYETTGNVKYYIYVKTYNREEVLILLTKDEYDLLEPMIEDIEDKIQDKFYGQDSKCTFCGSMESDCGGDHGDEMRDMQREALRDDTY